MLNKGLLNTLSQGKDNSFSKFREARSARQFKINAESKQIMPITIAHSLTEFIIVDLEVGIKTVGAGG